MIAAAMNGGAAPKQADAKPDVVPERLDPRAAPGCPDLRGDRIDPAELQHCRAPRFDGVHSRSEVFVDQQIERAAQLVIESAVGDLAVHEIAPQRAQTLQPGHRQSSSSDCGHGSAGLLSNVDTRRKCACGSYRVSIGKAGGSRVIATVALERAQSATRVSPGRE
jgi:hypothetical protein